MPVNDGEQESKDDEKVMHHSPALVVEDAPEGHHPDEDCRGALLSQNVREAEGLHRISLQRCREQQGGRSIQDCADAEEYINDRVDSFHTQIL